MCLGNPLTKDEYDVDDRIIAKLTGQWEGNFCGTVRSLTNGFYIIDYDNGQTSATGHTQILGLTLSTPHNMGIPDANIQNWLLQRVPLEAIENIRHLLGTPLTKREYDVDDSVIAISPYRREHPHPLIDREIRYGVVVNDLGQNRYTVAFTNRGKLPTEYHQILGLAVLPGNNAIQTQTLQNCLVQRVSEACIRPYCGNPQTRETYEVDDRIIATGEGPEWDGNFGDFGYAGTVRSLNHGIYSIKYDNHTNLWPTEHHQILGLTPLRNRRNRIPRNNLERHLLQNPAPEPDPIPKPDSIPKPDPHPKSKPDTDTTMIKDDLARVLKRLLCNDWWFGVGSEDKAMNVLSLCGYYSSKGIPQEIQSDTAVRVIFLE